MSPDKQPKILINAGPSKVGWHFHELWIRCPMMWSHNYLLKTPRRAKPALVKGSLFHVGAAQVLSRWQAARGGVKVASTNEFVTDPERFYSSQAAISQVAMVEGADWLKEAPQMLDVAARFESELVLSTSLGSEMRVAAVEVQLEADIGPAGSPMPYTQRADVVLEDQQGKLWIADHKTTSSLTDKTTMAFGAHGQMLGYQWFGQSFWGERFGGVLVHYAVMEGQDKPTTFAMVKPILSPWHLKRFPANLRAARLQIEVARVELAAGRITPWDLPMASSDLVCVHRYGACDYFDACFRGPQ